jgi:hypothetical protein
LILGARLAQWKSTSFTRKGPQVQVLQRAPFRKTEWNPHFTETEHAATFRLSALLAGYSGATQTDAYNDGRVRENTVQFQQDQTGAWRQVIPPELMPKLERILSDPPTVQMVGGK